MKFKFVEFLKKNKWFLFINIFFLYIENRGFLEKLMLDFVLEGLGNKYLVSYFRECRGIFIIKCFINISY